jgi:N6-L-threonylcarbamoyladenine synthase
MRILGIESSCDETAAAVVEDGRRLLSNVVASSMDIHAKYGGVIPELAARSHIEAILPVIQQALDDADCTWDDIDGIAVTQGAGLLGSLLIGVLAARTLAIIHNKPLYACNHVEGHIYANFLVEAPSLPQLQLPAHQPEFPMLGVIVSGGHSQLVLWQNHFQYDLLGQTHDDAIGEAFDKVAKIIGLPYPGGLNVTLKAAEGDPFAYKLPKARMGKYDFSFSGLKTAVLRAAQEAVGKDYSLPSYELPGLLSDVQKANIAASFQRVAFETIVDKVLVAFEEFAPKSVVIGGGVAADPELRRQLADRLPYPIEYTDRKLCGDNGAMIATLGCYKAMNNVAPVDPYTLEVAPNLSM